MGTLSRNASKHFSNDNRTSFALTTDSYFKWRAPLGGTPVGGAGPVRRGAVMHGPHVTVSGLSLPPFTTLGAGTSPS
jgi:hypothetical protein